MNVHYISWDVAAAKEILNSSNEGVLISVDIHPEIQKLADDIMSAFPNDMLEYMGQKKLADVILNISENQQDVLEQCNELLVEWEWLIEDAAISERNYFEDQLICLARILSARICSTQLGDGVTFVDPRDIVISDEIYGAATIDLEKSKLNVEKMIAQDGQLITTYGVSISSDNNMTIPANKKYWDTLLS